MTGIARAAHPRSRGENTSRTLSRVSGPGSSPLTRGKPVDGAGHVWLGGLIPAHAGKTRERPRLRGGQWAHPRSRGENGPRAPRRIASRGSSPLTRGKRPCEKSRGSRSPAHPRSRGENPWGRNPPRRRYGSSPLTRGKRTIASDVLAGTRLIPAHAGKTSCTNRGLEPTGAHPRSRGENRTLATAAMA